jgi:hypothetical protein
MVARRISSNRLIVSENTFKIPEGRSNCAQRVVHTVVEWQTIKKLGVLLENFSVQLHLNKVESAARIFTREVRR